MPTNVISFNKQIKDFSDKLVPEAIVTLHKKIVLDLLARIVLRNPVKTGRSQQNWQVDIGRTNEDEVRSSDPITSGLGQLAALKPFQTVAIFNNVPYIVFLEQGSSQQAPNGMVAVSIAELEAVFA